MSVPLRRMRPCVGSWKRATRSVTVVLPGAAAADQRDHRSARHGDVEVAHHRPAFAVLELDVLERESRRTTRGASRASGPVGLVVLPSPSTSNTRSIAASERCSSENELTMFQTGFSSRNVYHWNAMMSPTDARPTMFR